jgi:hypothetical protein
MATINHTHQGGYNLSHYHTKTLKVSSKNGYSSLLIYDFILPELHADTDTMKDFCFYDAPLYIVFDFFRSKVHISFGS